MKSVSFCKDIQVYHPAMQGQLSCFKKGPLSSEEEVLSRRSPFQKLH